VASLILYGFIALLAVGVLFGLAVWLLPAGEQIAPPAPDFKPWTLADHALSPQDVHDVRLPVALRGYRFAETDTLLDRLTDELRQRDEEISRLRGETPPPPEAYRPPVYEQPPVYEPDYDPTAVREQ
jgi:DivIVA domain-containing protein